MKGTGFLTETLVREFPVRYFLASPRSLLLVVVFLFFVLFRRLLQTISLFGFSFDCSYLFALLPTLSRACVVLFIRERFSGVTNASEQPRRIFESHVFLSARVQVFLVLLFLRHARTWRGSHFRFMFFFVVRFDPLLNRIPIPFAANVQKGNLVFNRLRNASASELLRKALQAISVCIPR